MKINLFHTRITLTALNKQLFQIEYTNKLFSKLEHTPAISVL